jgi:DNA-binding transcriptional ArsR family regulator
MLTVHLQPYDFQHYRFGQNPALDLATAVRNVITGYSSPRFAPSVGAAIASLSVAHFHLLATAVRRNFVADFIAPADLPLGIDLPEALEHSCSKDERAIIQELHVADRISALPDRTRHLVANALQNPKRYRSQICEVLHRLWKGGFGESWQGSRHFFNLEIEMRGRLMAEVGPGQAIELMLSSFGATLSGPYLALPRPFTRDETSSGRGLVLEPCPFLNGTNLVSFTSDSAMSISYSVEWPTDRLTAPGGALAGIMGAARARVLRALATKATTSHLAHLLRCTPAAISQHIGLLREIKLVESTRSGRQVIHRLTSLGHRLLQIVR